MQRQRFGLPLQLVLACRFVGDRGLGRAPGRLADQHRPGLGGGLDPRGGVDQVAGDHPLAFGADRHGRLAGEHARPRREARIELLHCGDQVERGPDRPLGVVLVRDRRPPHRHHGVADELLDGAAVQRDQPAAGLEVAGQQLTGVLRVAALGCGGEADEVGEEDGDHLPLGGRGAAAAGAAGAAAPAADASPRGAPQSPQNLFPGGFSAPHVEQPRARALPQSPQNRLATGFSAPQLHTQTPAKPRTEESFLPGNAPQGTRMPPPTRR